MLFLFCSAEGALSVPLNVYHERVRRAVLSLDSVGVSLQDEESERQPSAEKAALADVRGMLANDETVEWQGGVFRVDNRWLRESLDAYEQMAPADPKRVERLAQIVERLQALDERLSEIEAQPGNAVDKEAEKARLAAILRREEYTRQAAEGNALTRLIKRIREWLRRLFPDRGADEPQNDNPTVNRGAQIIVALLSLIVICYVAWRFLPRFLRREMKKRKRTAGGPRVVLGDHLSMDATSADLLAEAEQLARAGNLRGAIRKGYIALLCELHDRKLLRLEQHKTNRDYLSAVEDNHPLYDEMKPMTMSFETHWYGLVPATETDWQSFRAHYQQAVKQ
jgi:hypothetical protein